MDNAMDLKQSVLQDVVSLLNNDEAMKKLQKYIRHLKNEVGESSCSRTDDEILDDIRDGLREVKAAREGRIKLQKAEDFLNELRG